MGTRLVALALLLFAACSRPIQHARTEHFQPTFPAEARARERVQHAACSERWGLLFPGLGHLCQRDLKHGIPLLAAGAAELGTTIAVATTEADGISHPGAALPAIAFQDLWVYGVAEPMLRRQLAVEALYTPQDSAGDLLAAPYNLQVLKRPEVWAGLAGTLALGIGVSMLVDETGSTDHLGEDPNLFGKTVDRRVGYPLAFATGTGLFLHVAVAEEVVFRGAVQSAIARRSGETVGWLEASLLFGAVHSFNLVAIPDEQRTRYLLVGVPFITAIGGYLGWVYRKNDYSLAPSVALHFWYDLLLSATFFAMDPQRSPISAQLAFPF